MKSELKDRCALFVEAGLMPKIPTAWQVQQGTIEMTPYVMSTDATTEPRYRGALLGHPLLRQPLIISQVGLDWFRSGPAIGASLRGVMAHLHLTYHQGMPVFDLQLVQTHERGLDILREKTEELLANKTKWAQKQNKIASLILPRAHEYFEEFLGEDGWIARAERFDYPQPEEEDASFPREFFSLVEFLNYCAQKFPAQPADTHWTRMPAHVIKLLGRRFREGLGFGWFEEAEA